MAASNRRKRSKRLAQREELPLEELYTPYQHQMSFEIFSDLWSLVAEHLEINPSQLRSTDRFKKELNPYVTGIDDNLTNLFNEIKGILWRHQQIRRFRKIKTIEDYLLILAPLIKQENQSYHQEAPAITLKRKLFRIARIIHVSSFIIVPLLIFLSQKVLHITIPIEIWITYLIIIAIAWLATVIIPKDL